jgi:hypothetical protein
MTTEYNNAIVSIKDKQTGVDLSTQPFKFELMSHTYSNTKTPTARFILNDAVIKRNNSLVVGYKCLICKATNEITLNLYLRKINKNIRGCNACKNNDEQKRLEHSAFMLKERIVPPMLEKWSDKTLSERISESNSMFESEDDDFKKSYNLKHMTLEEFEMIRSKIISIGNKKIANVSEWTYLPNYRIGNQTKYTPMLLKGDCIEKPQYIEWCCESCNNTFINRDLEVQKNRTKILCADCNFANNTFKVRNMTTPWGKIRYQSIPERRFIEWCIEKSIQIKNGPDLLYDWNGKSRKYRVDFQLPELKMLIEIKDNHVWHKMQIENGKWGAKETIAKSWCTDNGWNYEIIYPKTLSNCKEKLVRYSLNLQETVRSEDKEPTR